MAPKSESARQHDSVLLKGPCEDFLIFCRVHSIGADVGPRHVPVVRSRWARRDSSALSTGNLTPTEEGAVPAPSPTPRRSAGIHEYLPPGDPGIRRESHVPSARQQPQHRGDRNSDAAHAGYSSHVRRIDGDALQFFVPACLLMAQAPLPVDKCRNRWFERGVPAAAGSSLLQFHRIRRQKVCLPASYIYQVECRHRRNSAASIRSWRYQGALRTSELRPSTTPQPAPPIPRHVPRDGT